MNHLYKWYSDSKENHFIFSSAPTFVFYFIKEKTHSNRKWKKKVIRAAQHKKTLPYLTIFSVDPIHIHLFEL